MRQPLAVGKLFCAFRAFCVTLKTIYQRDHPLHISEIIPLVTYQRKFSVVYLISLKISWNQRGLRPVDGAIDLCLYQFLADGIALLGSIEEYRHKERHCVVG